MNKTTNQCYSEQKTIKKYTAHFTDCDDTTPPEYSSEEINWPQDEHYWEIRGFFGKYKQCQKCGVVET